MEENLCVESEILRRFSEEEIQDELIKRNLLSYEEAGLIARIGELPFRFEELEGCSDEELQRVIKNRQNRRNNYH